MQKTKENLKLYADRLTHFHGLRFIGPEKTHDIDAGRAFSLKSP